MRAMILAAGLGNRLMPLTKGRPKPLLPVFNIPVIGIIIGQLKECGVTHLVINTHWLDPEIRDYIVTQDFGEMKITLSFEPQILGTAGGIKKVEGFFCEGPFIVVTGDVIHTIDLFSTYECHKKSGNLATLVLHDYPRFNQVELDEGNNIVSLRGDRLKATSSPSSLFAFTGIHIISPKLLQEIPEGEKVDIISLYQKLILNGASIKGEVVNSHYWIDIGSFQAYHQAHRDIYEDESRKGLTFFNDLPSPCVGAGSYTGEGCSFKGYVSIGHHTRIGNNCAIKDCIILDRVDIADGLVLGNCIIGDGATVRSSIKDEVIVGSR